MTDLPGPTWRPSNVQYHADPRWSASRLKTYRHSPALAYKMYMSGTIAPEPPTRAMISGSLVNIMLLLPDRMNEIHVVDVQDRKAKTFKQEFVAREDQLVVTLPEFELAEAIAGAILTPETEAAEVAHDLLIEGEGHPEFAMRWDDASGVPLKCMVDRLRMINGMPALIELKTTRHPNPIDFLRDFETLEYFAQCSFNRRGVRQLLGGAIPPVIIVFTGNEEPFEVAMPHQVSDWHLTEGDKIVARDLASLARKLGGEEPWCAEWERAPISGQLPVLEPSFWMQRKSQD